MTQVWLVLTSPYAYDRAMQRAGAIARLANVPLHAVFFIEKNAVGTMVKELSDTGWLGPGSLRRLQSSMSEGYRALAGDVLKRVQRKLESVDVISEGIVEEPSLADYLERLLQQGAIQAIVSGAKPVELEDKNLSERVEWIEED